MKKRWIWTTMVALALCIACFILLPTRAEAAEVDSGTCGDNLTWVLDDSGVLTISGTGQMDRYGKDNNLAPWFSKRANITEVIIEDGVASIGEYAFYASSKLTKISISKSVTSFGFHAFENCSQFEIVNISDLSAWCKIDFYTEHDPVSLDYHNNPLFYAGVMHLNGQKVVNLVIPENVPELKQRTFEGCTSITSVTIPAGVETISNNTFERCSNLISVSLPNSLRRIGEYAFNGCSKLSSVAIPESVTHIDYEAFGQCSNLTSVYITNLKSWCNIVYTSYDGDDGCNPLGNGAALYLNNVLVDDLVIPGDISYICPKAFVGCSSLTSVVIGDEVLSLGYGIFENCKNLTSVTIGNSIASIEGITFHNCSSLKNVRLGEGIVQIGNSAFSGCTGLTNISIPDGVNSLEHLAFNDCNNLLSVTIPDSVTYISSYVFDGCDNLWHVLYKGSESQWNEIDISNNNKPLHDATQHYNCTGDEVTDANQKICSVCYGNCNHKWDSGVTTKVATCTADGERKHTCSACGEVKYEPIATKGHSYGSEITNATCTNRGYTTYTCFRCNDSYKDNYVDSTGHVEVIDKAVEVTCTSAGSTEGKHCSVCNETITAQTIIPAKGHVDVNTDYICDACGIEICINHAEEVTPGTAATCEQSGLTDGKKCTTCGEILKVQEVIPATGHSYGAWTEVKAPTTEEVGLEERVCSCGDTEQRELAKLNPTPTDPKPTTPSTHPSTDPSTTTPTGNDTQNNDNNSVILIAVLVAVGGICVGISAVLIVLKKKK